MTRTIEVEAHKNSTRDKIVVSGQPKYSFLGMLGFELPVDQPSVMLQLFIDDPDNPDAGGYVSLSIEEANTLGEYLRAEAEKASTAGQL